MTPDELENDEVCPLCAGVGEIEAATERHYTKGHHMTEVRYHKKRDGILRIEPNGECRFLTILERIRYFFGGKP
jgi:hypothetical protein